MLPVRDVASVVVGEANRCGAPRVVLGPYTVVCGAKGGV